MSDYTINYEKSPRPPTDYAASTHAKEFYKKTPVSFASHYERSCEMLFWYTDWKVDWDDNR